MIEQLGWETLQERRAKMRLTLFYKATQQLIAIDSSQYLIPITIGTRQNHIFTFRQISTRTNYHRYSFYPNTIPTWNNLPRDVAEAPGLLIFKLGLANYAIPSSQL
jgi:hypothetical protein